MTQDLTQLSIRSIAILGSIGVMISPGAQLDVAIAQALPAPPVIFQDIGSDVYASQIERAFKQGIISGFPGEQRFRPLEPVTREQMVSIVINALPLFPLTSDGSGISSTRSLPKLSNFPDSVTVNPFPDVDAQRWSAAKIQYARDLGLVRGYADGTFRPTQAITRAELMVLLKNVTDYIIKVRGSDGRGYAYVQGIPPVGLTDIDNHWARSTIAFMSNRRIASPWNEQGTAFSPNSPALRNYAAAAMLWTIDCFAPAPDMMPPTTP